MRFAAPASLAIAALLAGSASAQAVVGSPQQACRPSAVQLCHDEVRAANRPAVRACLIRNIDKVAPECRAAMMAMKAQMEAAQSKAAPPSDIPAK